MTPYQIGFLACRLLAIYCLISAVWAFTLAYSTIKTITAANPEFASQIVFVTPVAVTGLLAIFLWAKAAWFAQVFVPEDDSKIIEINAGDLAATLFRALGLYFIVVSLPGAIAWLVEICMPENPSERALTWMQEMSRDAGLGSLLRLLIGIGLFFGFRRLGTMMARAPKRYMEATSLPDDD